MCQKASRRGYESIANWQLPIADWQQTAAFMKSAINIWQLAISKGSICR
jgi:hypothetical protein